MSSDGGDSPGRNNGESMRKDFKKDRIGGGNNEGPVDEGFAKYVRNLIKERDSLDPDKFPSTYRLVQTEIEKLSKGNNGLVPDPIFIDLYNDPPVTIQARCMPPSRLFPKFNYAGRIIGPKGSYLKALMKETTTKMVLLGKSVMKDKDKEDELRRGNDPKYFHLNEEMHVLITANAPAAEAYKRMGNAINCLKEQVLSDNRTLEGLPWVATAKRISEGGRPGGGGDSRSYSNNRSYPQSAPPSHQQHQHQQQHHRPSMSYDYPQPESPVYRRSHYEMSPPPRGGDSMKSYGDPYRRNEPSRSNEYVDRRGQMGMRTHASRSPPPPIRTYPAPAAYEESYGGYYTSAPPPDPYYNDNGNYRSPSRGGKSAHGARYAPYKK